MGLPCLLAGKGYGGYSRLTKAERQGGAPLILAYFYDAPEKKPLAA
jgi:hypothetical protein